MDKFKLVAPYKPMGDQIEAIKRLSENIELGVTEQTLLGATGTGKTFTIANVIANVNKPTLVLAHNKTLAGQLYSEFKEFFPENICSRNSDSYGVFFSRHFDEQDSVGKRSILFGRHIRVQRYYLVDHNCCRHLFCVGELDAGLFPL